MSSVLSDTAAIRYFIVPACNGTNYLVDVLGDGTLETQSIYANSVDGPGRMRPRNCPEVAAVANSRELKRVFYCAHSDSDDLIPTVLPIMYDSPEGVVRRRAQTVLKNELYEMVKKTIMKNAGGLVDSRKMFVENPTYNNGQITIRNVSTSFSSHVLAILKVIISGLLAAIYYRVGYASDGLTYEDVVVHRLTDYFLISDFGLGLTDMQMASPCVDEFQMIQSSAAMARDSVLAEGIGE